MLNLSTKFRGSFIRAPKDRAVLLCGVISLAAFGAARLLSPEEHLQDRGTRITAARIMDRAMTVLREHYLSRGWKFDDAVDPNHTGLIGVEYSEITTTLGTLEAKRTTTNPNMAGVIVQLLEEAGVAAGDTIAVGCSGSFPALAVATLAASEATGVYPVIILSLGSSSYGATKSDWTVLGMLEVLKRKGIADVLPAAVSLGGAKDVGQDFDPQAREQLIGEIRQSGIPFLYQSDLQRNVAERMGIYFGPSAKRRIAAFVNIGGSYADLGLDPLVLKLEPGVNKQMMIPAAQQTHGVVFAMANRHIPVVHLLHIKGLALKYGLPWDPIPLPNVADAGISHSRSTLSSSIGIIAAAYFSLMVLVFVLHRKAFF